MKKDLETLAGKYWRAGLGIVGILGLALVLGTCNGEKPGEDPGRQLDRSMSVEFGEILSERDLAEKLKRLTDFEARLSDRVGKSRLARILMLKTCTALAALSGAQNRPQDRADWEARLEARCRDYLARDPADGQVTGFVLHRLASAWRMEEAWQVLKDSADLVDLDTLDRLDSAAMSLEGLRHVRPDPGRAGSQLLVDFYSRLISRVQESGTRRELLEKLFSQRGLLLLGLGRIADARAVLRDMLALGVPGGHYFRLQAALDAAAPDGR